MPRRESNSRVVDDAFVVTVPDIHRVRYQEAERVAEVEIEGGVSDANQVGLKLLEMPHRVV